MDANGTRIAHLSDVHMLDALPSRTRSGWSMGHRFLSFGRPLDPVGRRRKLARLFSQVAPLALSVGPLLLVLFALTFGVRISVSGDGSLLLFGFPFVALRDEFACAVNTTIAVMGIAQRLGDASAGRAHQTQVGLVARYAVAVDGCCRWPRDFHPAPGCACATRPPPRRRRFHRGLSRHGSFPTSPPTDPSRQPGSCRQWGEMASPRTSR